MQKTLIIVDPQYDFIEGGKLPVNGGKEALDNVVDAINTGEFSTVLITRDCHNGKHCSFITEGGEFPEHCVEGTHGADIYTPIMTSIVSNNLLYYQLYKGVYTEEFSAFLDTERAYTHWIGFTTTDSKFKKIHFHKDEQIYVCGLAGDICVLNTLKVLTKGLTNITVLTDCIASLDGGNKLNEFIRNEHLKQKENFEISR